MLSTVIRTRVPPLGLPWRGDKLSGIIVGSKLNGNASRSVATAWRRRLGISATCASEVNNGGVTHFASRELSVKAGTMATFSLGELK